MSGQILAPDGKAPPGSNIAHPEVWPPSTLLNQLRSRNNPSPPPPRDVDIAVSRIRGIFCEVAAKRRRPTKMVLLHPPSMNLSATEAIANENHDLINRQVTVKPLHRARSRKYDHYYIPRLFQNPPLT
ncbi:hypothetical protein BZA05DRAFT_421401 [Tricharina praecox]|uniref:uncharacterized protein n=1 Tax=Tricharina praecox TaxID=43433 RepID=UPI00221F446A|nr:uncharacterized protein BZA05DRAFT_421401 [Tricharina praecox]KAI5845322.1 hypothetical protein BZA05DRAFT_421401 [Tricharina praecox]